jgi:type VI protein secretion system component VasK
MTESKTTEPTAEKNRRGTSVWMIGLLIIVLVLVGLLAGWTAALSARVDRLTMALRAANGLEARINQVADRLNLMDLEDRLDTIDRSIADMKRLAAAISEHDKARADEIWNVVVGLEAERETLQKQRDNYRSAAPAVGPDGRPAPRLEAAAPAETPIERLETPPSWWEKVINFHLFKSDQDGE